MSVVEIPPVNNYKLTRRCQHPRKCSENLATGSSKVASTHYCFCVCSQVLIENWSRLSQRWSSEANWRTGHGHSNQHSGQVQQATNLALSTNIQPVFLLCPLSWESVRNCANGRSSRSLDPCPLSVQSPWEIKSRCHDLFLVTRAASWRSLLLILNGRAPA